MTDDREPCVECGGPKGPGRGRRHCENCKPAPLDDSAAILARTEQRRKGGDDRGPR